MPPVLSDAFIAHAVEVGVAPHDVGINALTLRPLRAAGGHWESIGALCQIPPQDQHLFALSCAILVGESIDCKRQVRAVAREKSDSPHILVEALALAWSQGAYPMARLILPELDGPTRLAVLTRCVQEGHPEQVELCLPYVRKQNLHAVSRACVAHLTRTSPVSAEHLDMFAQLLARSDFENLPETSPHIIFKALTSLPDPYVGAVIQQAMPIKDAHWAVWTAYEEGRQEWASQLRAQARRPSPAHVEEFLRHVLDDARVRGTPALHVARQQFVQALLDSGVRPLNPAVFDRSQALLQDLVSSPPARRRITP